MSAKDIKYADTTYGAVRQNSESIFLKIKLKLKELASAEQPDGSILTIGQIGDEFFECRDQYDKLCQ